MAMAEMMEILLAMSEDMKAMQEKANKYWPKWTST
jgi:hypothetical protein